MRNKIAFHNKINVRILAMLLILFIITAIMISWANQNNLRHLYEVNFTERVLLTNAIMATMIDSEDVKLFVDLLTNQDEEFKQRQIQFYFDREEIYMLQEEGAPEEEQQPILDRLDEFIHEMAALKTEKYWDILSDLKELKESSHSTYVYIVADTGLTTEDGERLFTYIFDAEDYNEYLSYDDDGLGTCNVPEESLIEIYTTKKQMENVEYYLGEYGELYYAYAPILDKNGEVVAIMGTDLALGNMYSAISSSIYLFNTIFIVSFIIIMIMIFILLNNIIIRPLTSLTNTAYELAEGNVYAPTSETALKQKGEIGMLANAINYMSFVYQDMMNSTGKLFAAANVGMLDVRNDESKFKGDIKNVIKQINNTLDATMLYLNSIPESVFIMSKEFKTYFRNDHFIEFFGDMQAAEFIAKLFIKNNQDALPPEEREEFLKNQFSEIIKSENEYNTFWINDFCYSIIFKEIKLLNESESSILVIAIDITDITKEKEKAQAAAIAKSEFLANMSHEIRTPLNAIMGMANIVKKSIEGPDIALKSANQILTSSRHLLGILNDVLDMSKIESGNLEISRKPFRILDAYNELNGMIEHCCGDKNIEYKTNINEIKDIVIIGDKLRINQVLVNLLGNAVKFTSKGGKVNFSVNIIEETDKTVKLHYLVKDTGIGMSDEQKNKLFIPFEKAAKEVTAKFGGTGLGLAISQNLINMMGGVIQVKSELGAGSEFYFDICFEKGDDNFDLNKEPVMLDLTGKRIMIVEDIEINRVILCEHLASTGVSIDETEDGNFAVEQFKNSPVGYYDLIFMDIQMPIMDGYEATRQIRSLDRPDAKTVPILAISANAYKEDIESALASGMNAHIAKPVEINILMDMIKYYLEEEHLINILC